MQIDVLSQNTLKLTLSRLDMFDLDIRYESLSGKNPDTKRLLSHVLRTVKSDKSAGVDFSGERLFVEAFPRPDGGCMLYISCLYEESAASCRENVRTEAERRTVRLTAKPMSVKEKAAKAEIPARREKGGLLCKLDSAKELCGVCKNLSWQLVHGRLAPNGLESVLYNHGGEYRLLLRPVGDEPKQSKQSKALISSIASEYGELLSAESELPFTCEHYNLLVPEKAVEKMNELF